MVGMTNYVDYLSEYYDNINDKFASGEITYDKYLRLLDKLTQWEFIWRESPEEEGEI